MTYAARTTRVGRKWIVAWHICDCSVGTRPDNELTSATRRDATLHASSPSVVYKLGLPYTRGLLLTVPISHYTDVASVSSFYVTAGD